MTKIRKLANLSLALLLGILWNLTPAAVLARDNGSKPYFRDYNDGDISGWTAAAGTAALSPENGKVKAETQGPVILADLDSPSYANAEYELKLQFNNTPSRFGFVIRYADQNNYAVIQYDVGSWGWDVVSNGQETWGTFPNTSASYEAGREYVFKLRYSEDQVTLWVDGEQLFTAGVPGLPVNAGHVGLRSWFDSKTIYIDDVKVTKYEAPAKPEPKPIANTDTLESDVITVHIDRDFPRVKKYVWKEDGAELPGQIEGIPEIKINGESFYPLAASYVKHAASQDKGETAEYTLNISGIGVVLTVEMEVRDNVLNFRVTNLEENGEVQVRTLEFPNHDLVSVTADQSVAQETAVTVRGDWSAIVEEYNDLKSAVNNVSGNRTIAFLNSDRLAATIVNNVVNGYDKVRVNISDRQNVKTASLWNGAWTYRGSLVLEPEPLPWAKIILTPDANGDGTVDWQDGAIAYRDHAPVPYKSELIRDHISYIAMNIGSTTSSPFLRVLDNAKKMHNLTDGFGQIILFKGYQGEGHDDSHPDYGGHIGIRQGGKDEFNFVLREGKKYNILGGVHINATEYMLDAYETKMENLVQPLSKGWGWLDQAYYVDQTKDLESGELKRRLDMLKADTGDNLSFVYVDVYSGNGYNAKKLAEYINGHGWMLGTEYAGPLFEQAAWVHWGTDPAYPNQGNDSSIIRFIRNGVLDGFLSHPLLKGLKQVGVGYWQYSSAFYSYDEFTKAFFNHNLPTKYMQHFQIMKMTDDRIDFDGGVSVAREADGKVHLTKDGRDIAIMTDSSDISDSIVFIPWDPLTEEKIYHWNPNGGATTWTVPASWNDVQEAHLYRLTDLGREYEESVPVTNGQVTLTAEKGVGYVLYKTEAPEQPKMIWGEGSPVKDPGFDSHSFEVWKKSSTGPTTDHIQMVKNQYADGILQIGGPYDARVEQEITGLEPGKTYTASVWANIDGKRKVTLIVKQGDQEVSNYLEDTSHKYYAQQHKYYNSNYQRVKVNFDAISDRATLILQADAGNATVRLDDVRVWKNPTKTDPGDSVLFEDFENVDEGWGPFVYSRSGPVRTHLAETDPDRQQIKSYVLDGKYSLKTNESGAGEWLRTLPQTLRLKMDHKYRLKLDYQADTEGMYSIAVRSNEGGVVRDLAIHTLGAGRGTLDAEFQTDGAVNAYLAVIKNFDNSQAELTGTLVLDNIRVDELGPILPEEGVLVENIRILEQDLYMQPGNTVKLTAIVEPANAYNRTLSWSSDNPAVAAVDEEGNVTAVAPGAATITAASTDGSQVTATSTITVYEANVKIPQSQMTATASSYEPVDPPQNALDGNPNTMWHTAWYTPHLPEHITIDLGGTYYVNQLNYLPRPGAGNGTITRYNIYASADGVNFAPVASGTWARNDAEKTAVFPKVRASHIRLEAVDGFGGFASAAEINIFHVPATPDEPGAGEGAAVWDIPLSVTAGEEFAARLGLRDVERELYAQDIKISYEPPAVEFVTAAPAADGISLLETSHDPEAGTVRFILASLGPDHPVTGTTPIMELKFRAKEVADSVQTTLTILHAVVSDGEGTETELGTSDAVIEIRTELPGIPGDTTGDGKVTIGDLAVIAAHYGKTSSDPDWGQAKRADVNGDGKVDLDDLVHVALKILEE